MKKPKNRDNLKMRKSRKPTAALHMLWTRGRRPVTQAQGSAPPHGRQEVGSQGKVQSLQEKPAEARQEREGCPGSSPGSTPLLAEPRQKQSQVGDPGEMQSAGALPNSPCPSPTAPLGDADWSRKGCRMDLRRYIYRPRNYTQERGDPPNVGEQESELQCAIEKNTNNDNSSKSAEYTCKANC